MYTTLWIKVNDSKSSNAERKEIENEEIKV